MNRRQTLAALLAGLGAAAGVRAQSYPAKPIRIIVGYSAGGAVDIPLAVHESSLCCAM